MTVPNPLTREELVELAALDAYGLLEDYESSLFTRSFHHAPAAVQTEILELQADLAGDTTLLLDEEPSPELRQRVLESVAAAMENESSELAPLATIGGSSKSSARESVGRIGGGASRHFWRAAAFAMAGAVLVMAYFVSEANQRSNSIVDLVIHGQAAQLEALMGPLVDDYLFSSSPKVALNSTNENPNMAGALLFDEDSVSVCMIHRLPKSDEDYTLRVLLEDGTSQTVSIVKGTGEQLGASRAIDLPFTLAAVARWEVVNAAGAVLLTSA